MIRYTHSLSVNLRRNYGKDRGKVWDEYAVTALLPDCDVVFLFCTYDARVPFAFVVRLKFKETDAPPSEYLDHLVIQVDTEKLWVKETEIA